MRSPVNYRSPVATLLTLPLLACQEPTGPDLGTLTQDTDLHRGRGCGYPEITIIDVGTISGTDTDDNFGYDINDRGQVVGESPLAGNTHAFVWTERRGMIDLGAWEPVAINERGTVVGSAIIDHWHAVMWSKRHGMTDLGSLGGHSQAWDINDRGEVVGNCGWRQFLWDKKRGMIDLATHMGVFGGAAYALNNRGQVVGDYVETITGPTHAYLWSEKEGFLNLGTLGGNSSARGINDHGDVVGGTFVVGDVQHAFLWTRKDGMIDLGTLGGTWSWATDINEKGQVVGAASTASGEQRAFLWTRKDGMIDLGTLGGSYGYASAINNHGVIAGTSANEGENQHPVIWKLSECGRAGRTRR